MNIIIPLTLVVYILQSPGVTHGLGLDTSKYCEIINTMNIVHIRDININSITSSILLLKIYQKKYILLA